MLKVLFAGTPGCAVPALEKTAETHTIAGILTAPPSAKGRSGVLRPSEIAEAAEKLKATGKIPPSAPILQPDKITDEIRAEIAATGADILVCFAYGKIFSAKTLALFPKGGINIHPSLLPRWRGPAPVPAAILAGDTETGVTIQRIALEMDAGDVLRQEKIPLTGEENTDTLLRALSAMGAEMAARTLSEIENGTATETPQAGAPTFSEMLAKKDGKINWNESARKIDAKIRAFTPWPGAFTTLSGGENLLLFIRKARVYGGRALGEGSPSPDTPSASAAPPGTVLPPDDGILVQTGDGILLVERLQKQAKKEMDWRSFLNGTNAFISSKLGDNEERT